MFFRHRAFWLPKDVEQEEHYQDAYAADDVKGVAAIADGVSSSLFASSWAQLLVRAAVDQPPTVEDPKALGTWLGRQRQQWRAPIDVEKLAWHQRAKFKDGAFTTLLWVELDAADVSGAFPMHCHSLGDCCLFHVRDNEVLRAFPYEHSSMFDTTPKMVGSAPGQKGARLEFDTLHDVCRAGDLLMLCTDALAVRLLTQLEAGASLAWDTFWNLTQITYSEYIIRLREQQQIRYDDTTVLILRIGDDPARKQQAQKSKGLFGELKKSASSLLSGTKTNRR
jgi:hypothetical protein